MSQYDYLIVGAGIFGAVFAKQMTDAGRKCLVLDQRQHIGGNCFTEKLSGINIHCYGPHIFHTNNRGIWDYVNRFISLRPFNYRVKSRVGNTLYSFPINLLTLNQLWGVTTPEEARQKLDAVRIPIASPCNLEEWILSQVGEELYRLFIYGYTLKQWKREPRDLPADIIKRLPIRLTYEDGYFSDDFQGIPQDGYTPMFEQLLEESDVRLETDYFSERSKWESKASRIIYTGRIDEFFNCCHGLLEYRTLRFERKLLQMPDFQGCAVINYPDLTVPFTRIVEHKHFEAKKGNQEPNTVVTWEFPENWTPRSIPYYPINDPKNRARLSQYRTLAKRAPNVVFGGRLAEYQYYDMHQVIAGALSKAHAELQR